MPIPSHLTLPRCAAHDTTQYHTTTRHHPPHHTAPQPPSHRPQASLFSPNAALESTGSRPDAKRSQFPPGRKTSQLASWTLSSHKKIPFVVNFVSSVFSVEDILAEGPGYRWRKDNERERDREKRKVQKLSFQRGFVDPLQGIAAALTHREFTTSFSLYYFLFPSAMWNNFFAVSWKASPNGIYG